MAVDEERYQQALRDRAKTQRDAAREAFREAGDEIQRRLGVKIDTGRLDVEEVQELRSLVSRVTHVDEVDVARAGGLKVRGWNLALLDRKQTRRFEQLVEKGADMRGMFKARRDEAKQQQRGAEIKEAVRREFRPQRPKLLEKGTVQLPGWLAEWLRDEHDFGIADVGWLATMLLLIENRGDWYYGSSIDDDGALVVNIDAGFAGLDPDQLLTPRRKQFLDFLVECQLLTVAKSGNIWRINRGPALLADEQAALKPAERKAS